MTSDFIINVVTGRIKDYICIMLIDEKDLSGGLIGIWVI
jgi:hypothetical protein